MTAMRVGINGFGRIGRQVVKAMYERRKGDLEIVAINDLYDINTSAHLLEFDTTYGRAPEPVRAEENTIHYGDWAIQCFAEKDPRNLPWADLGVDIVIESTGLFTQGPKARAHIEAGAKKVIISAPAKEEDITIVMGVNHDLYDPAKHVIISNASCTTNCLAPAAKVIHELCGIASGLMCTIHSYTNDQRILDLPHKDLRRARAAAQNIVPTSTGAAKAVALVIPALKGKVDGYSFRVPTATVSVVDFAFEPERPVTTEALRQALKDAAEGPLKGILGYNTRPLVSSDFKGDARSSIVEEEYTRAQSDGLAKLVTWYDNEWGYSCRVADLAGMIRDKGL
ncbi:type I glyceraldehyde-3-phosphate dehydrogenase [Megalodesulfovibrio gigas]|uniref:Glyceraldehyde-3-phosphate dehydrogenase n=1 Tax=Megalodesulfovibrio gigas (strain ATCC 19364 / DSM 1382 / NCIMB 9332 / VKM B-1759) TaxID=1121448 RepID=T2GDM7_MEGG1|nr:type I glyceraldehyde-3-phosphate dehydrogenase [Megalodesulfovibrio gigas]AGW14279.1 putative glyceraldehyde-3-phosphate dehydrogenase, type I [Megalodesulfovibrio gigas DSM 1382 = ATCC 19364]